jgi:uncharacterized protein YbjT (DUF2867 family)
VLLARGHRVRALVRPESMHRVSPVVEPVVGNALDAESFRRAIRVLDVPAIRQLGSAP